MAITIGSTKTAAQDQGIKCLVYGASGTGKTFLSSTLPGVTVILSAEAGLLSLRQFDIDSTSIKTMQDLKDAYKFLCEDKKYSNIVIDSLSEIAEAVLVDAKSGNKDGRMAYGDMAEAVVKLVKAFRDLPGKNVVMIAKVERTKDELSGAMLYNPSFPGTKLGQALPYLFDEVFALRTDKDEEGNTIRYLQTARDNQFDAKDRSGTLNQFEKADMGIIFGKINGSTTTTKKGAK
jgi:phage nucleotide-binding protein